MGRRLLWWVLLPLTIATIEYHAAPYLDALWGLIGRLRRIPGADVREKDPQAVRIGILGAASIAQYAVVWPCGKTQRAVAYGVAARDHTRAEAFGTDKNITRVFPDYEAMLADDSIDAVYIAVVTPLHYTWARKALLMGKHVLVEKPLTWRPDEARELDRLAADGQKVLFEALHYRYHPAVRRLEAIVTGGTIGTVTSVKVHFALFDPKEYLSPTPPPAQWHMKMYDRWCYCIDLARMLLPGEPLKVLSASATNGIQASLATPTNQTVEFHVLKHTVEWRIWVDVRGTAGGVRLVNFLFPFVFHSLEIEVPGEPMREKRHYEDGRTTFEHQMDAFVATVQEGTSFATDGKNAIANAAVAADVLRALEVSLVDS